ncbi:hypothetical protein C8F01DRAFT_310741 [Mycena amicta]|nr:hypothetical protein C8F01DRAFT_310741 [Mycena amicta]
MDDAEIDPPPYSGATVPNYSSGGGSIASGIAPRAAIQSHKYSLESKGRSWLYLHFKSRAAASASMPYFIEGDVVEGQVELDLDKAESAKAVTVQLLGGVTYLGSGQPEFVFLDLKEELWTAGSDKNAKLEARKHAYSFSFPLPRQVSVQKDNNSKNKIVVDAPPSFDEKTAVDISYRLVVTMKRGPLKPNSSLSKTFGYVPLSQPEPPSKMCQISYKEGTELLGPEGDPYGWLALKPVEIKGKLFDAMEVAIRCTVYLARPLTYTIGSVCPISLTLEGDNEIALDTFANPKAIKLFLVRSFTTGATAMDELAVQNRKSNTVFLSAAGQAYFWPSLEGAKQHGRRTLRGEIEVKSSVKPSFLFPRISTRYTIDLLPFSTTGFTPSVLAPGKPLVSESVRIVTQHAPGIIPRSYAPSGIQKPDGSEYNAVVGILDNGGNQRMGELSVFL